MITGITDYGMGNLHSISSAVRKLGYKSKISFSEDEIIKSSHIILPGVGEFREAMHNLDKDRKFLIEGGVFTDDQIDAYIDLKFQEIYKFEHTPHPIEFEMYYSQ